MPRYRPQTMITIDIAALAAIDADVPEGSNRSRHIEALCLWAIERQECAAGARDRALELREMARAADISPDIAQGLSELATELDFLT